MPDQTNNYFDIIFPIVTLFLGVAIDRGIEFFNNRKKITKEGEQWLGEVKHLLSPIKNQIKQIDEFLEEHNNEGFTKPHLVASIQLKGDSFKSLSKASFYEFVKRKKFKEKIENPIEYVNKVYSRINIAESLYYTMDEKFKSYINNCTPHVTSFNDALNKFLKEHSAMLLELEKKGKPFESDETLFSILEMLKEHIYPVMDDGKMDLILLQSTFLKPILEFLADKRMDTRANILIEHISNCNKSIIRLRYEKGYLTESLGNIKESHTENLVEIKSLLEKLEDE